MTFYTASFSTILWRFYAMTAIGIFSVMSGLYFLSALCLPLLLMCLLGVSFGSEKNEMIAVPRQKTMIPHAASEAA